MKSKARIVIPQLKRTSPNFYGYPPSTSFFKKKKKGEGKTQNTKEEKKENERRWKTWSSMPMPLNVIKPNPQPALKSCL